MAQRESSVVILYKDEIRSTSVLVYIPGKKLSCPCKKKLYTTYLDQVQGDLESAVVLLLSTSKDMYI